MPEDRPTHRPRVDGAGVDRAVSGNGRNHSLARLASLRNRRVDDLAVLDKCRLIEQAVVKRHAAKGIIHLPLAVDRAAGLRALDLRGMRAEDCLLYTSDAADDLLC